jgi:hypothetical protein
VPQQPQPQATTTTAAPAWGDSKVPPAGGVNVLDRNEYTRYKYGISTNVVVLAESPDEFSSRVMVLDFINGAGIEQWVTKIAEGRSGFGACEGFKYRRPMLLTNSSHLYPDAQGERASQARKLGIDKVRYGLVSMSIGRTINAIELTCNIDADANRHDTLATMGTVFGMCRHCGATGHQSPNRKGQNCTKPAFAAFDKPMI